MSKERLEKISFKKTEYPEVAFSLFKTMTRTYRGIPVQFNVYNAYNREGNYMLDDWVTYKIDGFPELYFGSNALGMNPFPTKKSDWKEFDIYFGQKIHDLLAGDLTEEQDRIAQALEAETGYAEIAKKEFSEAVESYYSQNYRRSDPIFERLKNAASRLRRK